MMYTLETAIVILVLLQIKHFVADYLLQPGWILAGKGDLSHSGGYVHAGIHALGSLPALAVSGIGLSGIAAIALAEFVIHYAIDFGKATLSLRVRSGPTTRIYWAMHGADQFLHQLTYIAMVILAMQA